MECKIPRNGGSGKAVYARETGVSTLPPAFFTLLVSFEKLIKSRSAEGDRQPKDSDH